MCPTLSGRASAARRRGLTTPSRRCPSRGSSANPHRGPPWTAAARSPSRLSVPSWPRRRWRLDGARGCPRRRSCEVGALCDA
eukprot:819467-Prymnesium_polylepis.1